jgi:hypothetical protein
MNVTLMEKKEQILSENECNRMLKYNISQLMFEIPSLFKGIMLNKFAINNSAGHAVTKLLKALRYKRESHAFHFRLNHSILFPIDPILQTAL